MGFDGLVEKAGYPGTKKIPTRHALLNLLSLKLVDKERLSHIDDFNCDEVASTRGDLNGNIERHLCCWFSCRTMRHQLVHYSQLAGVLRGHLMVHFWHAPSVQNRLSL